MLNSFLLLCEPEQQKFQWKLLLIIIISILIDWNTVEHIAIVYTYTAIMSNMYSTSLSFSMGTCIERKALIYASSEIRFCFFFQYQPNQTNQKKTENEKFKVSTPISFPFSSKQIHCRYWQEKNTIGRTLCNERLRPMDQSGIWRLWVSKQS